MEPAAEIRIVSTAEMTRDWLHAVAELKSAHWRYPLESQIAWMRTHVSADEEHVLAVREGALVGYIRLANRAGMVGGQKRQVVGVSNVIVAPELRGHDLGRHMIEAVNRKIEQAPTTIGLLQCGEDVARFYARCGWAAFGGPVIGLGGSDAFFSDACVMAFPPERLAGVHTIAVDGQAF